MKTAILYIRVSTDEQADTGYSQRHQEEMLRRYCELQNIQIRQAYFEDHSAKNFDRPAFRQLLLQLRKEKGLTDLLLFTKWDRFSRNAGDAYAMIKTLEKLAVEPQAIEQPLDLSIPENKMMLAFYLAAPEVENDRRSLNVANGMRRALKEGRYMGKAPIGYLNRKDEKRKWISPDPATAPIVVSIFHDIAQGKYSAESVMKSARSRGLEVSKNNYWSMLRNPVYCGKIRIPAWKNEPEQLIQGQHQPLITEDLFYQVQDVLDGKKKIQRAKKTVDDRFPLRGYVRCHADGRLLTASSSKGRSRRYEYYHCTTDCGTRFPAAILNQAILAELRRWSPHPAVKALYKLILQDVLSQERRHQMDELKKSQQLLKNTADRMAKARDLLLSGSIEPDDYRIIKAECESTSTKLEAQLAAISLEQNDIQPMIDASIEVLSDLAGHYERASTEMKREILGSIFPEKLEFDGHRFRTARVNEAVRVIFSLGAAFSEIKMGQVDKISDLSHQVIPLVRFSNHFAYDLRRVATLYTRLKAS